MEGKGSKTRIVPVGEIALRSVAHYTERARPVLAAAAPARRDEPRCSCRSPAGGCRLDVRRRLGPGARTVVGGVGRRQHQPATHLLDGEFDLRGHPGAPRPRLDLNDPDLHSGRVSAPEVCSCGATAPSSDPSNPHLSRGDERQGHRAQGHVAPLQGERRPPGPRAPRRRVPAAGEVRRAAWPRLPAHVDEADHLLRVDRADQRHRALRPRARDQVRDVRDHAHQGRDHRRAAPWTGSCAASACAWARSSGPTPSSSTAPSARPPTRRWRSSWT